MASFASRRRSFSGQRQTSRNSLQVAQPGWVISCNPHWSQHHSRRERTSRIHLQSGAIRTLQTVHGPLFSSLYSTNKLEKLAARLNKPEQNPSNLAYEKTRNARGGSPRDHRSVPGRNRHSLRHPASAPAADRGAASGTRSCGFGSALLPTIGGRSTAAVPTGVSLRTPLSAWSRPRLLPSRKSLEPRTRSQWPGLFARSSRPPLIVLVKLT